MFTWHLKKISCLLVTLILFALSGNALAGEKILRVGVAWQDGVFMRNADGSYSGYMVEYFAKLAQYAGWKYEFVPSDPISSSMMLQNGEVDLGSYILKTPQREKLYDFPAQSSGVLPLSVIARADNEGLRNNSPFRWGNLKVAFWGNSEPTKVSFEIFARNNAITYTSTDFARYEDAVAAVESGRADVFVHRVVDLPPTLCVVRQFDYKPFFTVCGKNNPKLLRELEEATQTLKVNEPAFLDSLTRKYFKIVKSAEHSRKRIRIGFYQEDGYYGFDQFGTRFGYNVDYMSRIAKINNWDLDYVDVSFSDALKLLEQGKIDVVCTIGKSPEREKKYAFPSLPSGFYSATLLVKSERQVGRIEKISDLNNRIVGVQKGNLMTQNLRELLKRQNVNCKIVEYDSMAQLFAALDADKCDAAVGSVPDNQRQYRVLSSFDPFLTYFCTNINNKKLVDEIDSALKQIRFATPNFESFLNRKYFRAMNYGEVNFTEEERAFIEKMRGRKINVVFSDSDGPIQNFKSENNQVGGFAKFLLEYIAQRSSLQFQVLPPNGVNLARERLESGSADCWIGYRNLDADSELEITAADYIKLQQVRIFSPDYYDWERTNPVVALDKNDQYMRHHAAQFHPEWQVREYDSALECYEAVLERRADFTLDNIYCAQQMIYENSELKSLLLHPVDLTHDYYPYTFTFAAETDPLLISIVDKCLRNLRNDQINNMLFEATIKDLSPPLLSPFALSVLIGVVLLFVLFSVVYWQYRRRQTALARLKLLEEHNVIQRRLLQQNQIVRECFEVVTSPISPSVAIDHVAALIAKYLSVSQLTILSNNLDDELFEPCEKRAIIWPEVLSEKRYPQLAQKMVEAKCIFIHLANDGSDSPAVSEDEVRFLQDNCCRNFYARKLSVNNQIWGFLWFTDDKKNHLENEQLAALDMLGNTIEMFLERIEISRRMESEAQFKQTIFQASPIPLLLFDCNKNIQLYNAQAQNIVGGDSETVIRTRCFELMCAEKRNVDSSPVQQTLLTGKPQLMRMKLLERWYDISTMPIFKNGRIVNVLQAMVDQTDMIQSEQHYRETSELFQSVLDTVPCQVFVKDYDNDGRYVVVNKYLQRFYNISEADFVGHTDGQVFGDAVGNGYRSEDMMAFEKSSIEFDQESFDRDGKLCYLHTYKVKINSYGGRNLLLGVSFNMSEIHQVHVDLEKKQVELTNSYAMLKQYLAQSTMLQKCMENLVQTLEPVQAAALLIQEVGRSMNGTCFVAYQHENHDIFAQWYAHENIKRYNGRIWPEFPLLQKRILEKNIFSCIRGMDTEDSALNVECEQYLTLRSTNSAFFVLIKFEGKLWGHLELHRTSQVPYNELEIHLALETARLFEVILASRLLLKKLYQKEVELTSALKDAQAAAVAKSMFLATMSHEIRTPLNAVIGFSDLLSNGKLTPEEMNEYTSGIAHASKALLRLINDILDLSKIESNTEKFADGNCNLNELLDELQAIFIHKAHEKGLSLEMVKPNGLPVVRIREQSMRQILLNIVGNAMKFTLIGYVRCRIEFAPLPDSSDITLDIFIEDSGVGISPEYCKTIFDPFVQQHNVRGTKVFDGTGLGLPIAKRLTEKMGGTLSLRSELGVGSSFHIHFDRVETLAAASSGRKTFDAPNTLDAGRKIKVLVVDDIRINLRVMGGYLKQLHVESIFASSGAEALQILRNTPDIDVVMTDMWMPDLNGAELASEIHSDCRWANLPIIAVTADIEAKANFDLSNFSGVLNKPIELNKLHDLLSRLS